jgi:hypothetical protein
MRVPSSTTNAYLADLAAVARTAFSGGPAASRLTVSGEVSQAVDVPMPNPASAMNVSP